jgi:hypothetical protein
MLKIQKRASLIERLCGFKGLSKIPVGRFRLAEAALAFGLGERGSTI